MSFTNTLKSVYRLIPYIQAHLVQYCFGAVSLIVYVGTVVLIPLVFGWVIAAFEEDLTREEVLFRIIWFVVVSVFAMAVRFISRTLMFNIARRIEYSLRNDLLRHLQSLPQSFYSRWRTGDLMSRCVNDLNSIRLMLGVGVLNILQAPVMFVGVLIVMMSLDPLLTVCVLIPYPLFLLIARLFGRVNHNANLAVQEGLGDLSNQVQECISGIAVIKTYGVESASQQRFDKAAEALFKRHIHLIRVSSAIPAMARLLPGLAMGLVLWVSGDAIVDGTMKISEFFVFAMYIQELTFPTIIMGWVFALIQRGAASTLRIQEILDEEPSIADGSRTVGMASVRGEIEFRGLNFQYPGMVHGKTLSSISLRIRRGDTLGIVGPVGSGKSTLISLIPRIYEVPDDQLFIDGIDINRIPLKVLRGSIAMVPQEPFLFSMTLGANVTYGMEDPKLARMQEASRRADLVKDIEELDEGYATIVGERGVMLSGGQRQRVTLARALALDRPILILDDTLSSVDAVTDLAIQKNIHDLYRGKTVIVVTHRLSAVRDADQIAVLDGGQIVELGTHEMLIRAGGLYTRLAQKQEIERELEIQDEGAG